MKIFISWSGERSKALAEAFRQWLPAVVQAAKPYFSPDDIAKGSRWSTEIAAELEASRLGLIFLTPENLDAPWIMFETGALSKSLTKSKVCPLLFELDPADVKGPLVQFQAARFSKTEIARVVKMINGELGESAVSSPVLDEVIDMWWPKLEARANEILAAPHAANSSSAQRPEREILEEILALTRSGSLRREHRLSRAGMEELLERWVELVEGALISRDLGLIEMLIRFRRPLGHVFQSNGTHTHYSRFHKVTAPLFAMQEVLQKKRDLIHREFGSLEPTADNLTAAVVGAPSGTSD